MRLGHADSRAYLEEHKLEPENTFLTDTDICESEAYDRFVLDITQAVWILSKSIQKCQVFFISMFTFMAGLIYLDDGTGGTCCAFCTYNFFVGRCVDEGNSQEYPRIKPKSSRKG